MRIKSIELQNFRNIKLLLSLQAAPDVNVIHGENAARKDQFNSPKHPDVYRCKSFRGFRDREMIRFWREDHCRTDLVFQSALRSETASIELTNRMHAEKSGQRPSASMRSL